MQMQTEEIDRDRSRCEVERVATGEKELPEGESATECPGVHVPCVLLDRLSSPHSVRLLCFIAVAVDIRGSTVKGDPSCLSRWTCNCVQASVPTRAVYTVHSVLRWVLLTFARKKDEGSLDKSTMCGKNRSKEKTNAIYY